MSSVETVAPGFLVNDPEHTPFGARWLRGITPLRVAFFAGYSFVFALPEAGRFIVAGEYGWAAWTIWDRWARTLACGLPMFLLIVKTHAWTLHASPRRQIVALALAVVLGAALYAALRTGLRAMHGTLNLGFMTVNFWQLIVAYSSRALIVGGLMTTILYLAGRERETALRLHRTRLESSEIERQLVEAQLNLLRTQIEPHFLFNSLASVKRLYQKDPGKGHALLRNLVDYLRVASRLAREREIALGEEIGLARAILGVYQQRMGTRLGVAIEVPEAMHAALVPPLTLVTLIENAVKHGIGPRSSGGTVRISAERQGASLVVAVRDDGVGFRIKSGTGIGLANIRSRLETLFGASGSLELAANPGGGVTATLRIPHRMGEAA